MVFRAISLLLFPRPPGGWLLFHIPASLNPWPQTPSPPRSTGYCFKRTWGLEWSDLPPTPGDAGLQGLQRGCLRSCTSFDLIFCVSVPHLPALSSSPTKVSDQGNSIIYLAITSWSRLNSNCSAECWAGLCGRGHSDWPRPCRVMSLQEECLTQGSVSTQGHGGAQMMPKVTGSSLHRISCAKDSIRNCQLPGFEPQITKQRERER